MGTAGRRLLRSRRRTRAAPGGPGTGVVAGQVVVSVGIVRLRSGRPLPQTAWGGGRRRHHRDRGVPRTDHELRGESRARAGARCRVRRRGGERRRAGRAGDACLAVVTLALSAGTGRDIAGALTSWPLCALLAGGFCSLLLTQTAYKAVRPMVTLPAIAAVTPMASVAIGAAFLGETARLGAGRAIAAGSSPPSQPSASWPAPYRQAPRAGPGGERCRRQGTRPHAATLPDWWRLARGQTMPLGIGSGRQLPFFTSFEADLGLAGHAGEILAAETRPLVRCPQAMGRGTGATGIAFPGRPVSLRPTSR